MMSATLLRNEVIVSSDELTTVRQEMTSSQIKGLTAVLANGETRELPAEITKIINLAFQALAANGSVTMATLPSELTSNTAAEILGISRPTLLKLSKEGEINSFKVGTHTRFRRDDVLAFKVEREASRRKILEDILAIEEQLDQ